MSYTTLRSFIDDLEGNRIIFEFPILIDSTWKQGYRESIEFDPDTVNAVEKKWDKLGLAEV